MRPQSRVSYLAFECSSLIHNAPNISHNTQICLVSSLKGALSVRDVFLSVDLWVWWERQACRVRCRFRRATFLHTARVTWIEMDERTADLRDLFLDVSEEATVTESQEVDRGSLVSSNDYVEEDLRTVIRDMTARFDFSTGFEVETLSQIVQQFYAGSADDEIAENLDCSSEQVFEARMELHLVAETERLDPEVATELRQRVDVPAAEHISISDAPLDETVFERPLAEFSRQDGDGDVSERTLGPVPATESAPTGRLGSIFGATERARRVNYRYRAAFEDILTDSDLRHRLVADAHEDGLEEATEDAEVDVDF